MCKVEMLSYLKEDGTLKKDAPSISGVELVAMYKLMVKSRIFDLKAMKLQRQGRFGTYAPFEGQEASQVGSAWTLTKEDWMVPTFRDACASFAHGLPMEKLIQYWQGDERGHNNPGINVMPIAIPVATQIPHAVGIAWGNKMQNKKSVVMVYAGDGATSEGDFNDGMNFAGVFKVPCVIVVQNNQWAISLPREEQTAAETLAQKAFAYGFEGVQVDGNDIFAVYDASKKAVDKARKGGGPTLIECITYRLAHHTTADDATKYRKKEEVEKWRKKDPIIRLRKYLEGKKLWGKKKETEWLEKAEKEVNDAVKKAESVEAPDIKDIFAHTFAEMTAPLKKQYENLKRFVK